MKVAIFGAGGIIGQTMRLYVPDGLEVRYYRRTADRLHGGTELTSKPEREVLLERFAPDVILNLAGENRPDRVEAYPAAPHIINTTLPRQLAEWCDEHGSHYVHVSTQGVFSGDEAPYSPDSAMAPVNRYGQQKAEAEEAVRQHENWTIVRPTFVMGVRPLPCIGRQNPAEQMLANPDGKQVNDRWFSPLFARDAAEALWRILLERPKRQTLHLGTPVRLNRCQLATALGGHPEAVSHDSFDGLAPRPIDTHYTYPTLWRLNIPEAVPQCRQDWDDRTAMNVRQRAREIALFLGISEKAAHERLSPGFGAMHKAVAADYREANPQDDDAILEWYRETESYIWELSAYHCDKGFNYTGTCKGVCDHLQAGQGRVIVLGDGKDIDAHLQAGQVCALVLGDGIGDLTLRLRQVGVDAVYHELAESRTAAFGMFRLWMYTGKSGELMLGSGWVPPAVYPGGFDAVVCLDFLEHVTDVPAWLRAIYAWLKPGGEAMFQNAFGAGSGSEGSIPMHLARNDKYVSEWTPIMAEIGFQQQGTSNWWSRPV